MTKNLRLSEWLQQAVPDDGPVGSVVDDSRALVPNQPGQVLVWDSRIAPQLTDTVLAAGRAAGARLVSDVQAPGVLTVPDAGAALAAYAGRYVSDEVPATFEVRLNGARLELVQAPGHVTGLSPVASCCARAPARMRRLIQTDPAITTI